ncbi:MAG TPA: PKD domain-containing protein [Blastocatellia bacterium]|nr:PKD domain-containing protein [Blastocatellia bacterium]
MRIALKLGRHRVPASVLVFAAWALLGLAGPASAQTPTCNRTITADVVALDQVFFWNRLGAVQPQGMIFALRRDVVPIDAAGGLTPGNVQLRSDKRPRPIALRMNVGDCLQIKFQNLLSPTRVNDEQPATRSASVHVNGMQLRNSIADDGSNVGRNISSVVPPGGSAIYTLYAEREGAYMMHNGASTVGGEGDGGSLNAGMFGTVHVEAKGAQWYRSQVTANDLSLATIGTTPDGHPIINYSALYPAGHPRAGLPILAMLQGNEVVHTDLNAIITGTDPSDPVYRGRFPGTYQDTPANPDRNQPFREFTVIYHDEIGAVQAFPQFEQQPLKFTLHSVRDAFAFNYGTGGIGAEIIANRIGVGPMANCVECKYEEFFLTAWAVGDPAMVVDIPANAPCTPASVKAGTCAPTPGLKATKALYPDDPSNVFHSYINDHVKMRVVHGGSKEHHIHHLHAHQWVHTPDSDDSAYLDSQALGPGSSFIAEITYNGTGNRNKVVGDSIFHCHFYPHFAMGMWAMWRSHDVFEAGTRLDQTGRPATGARALPDGEIMAGSPIPAVVPLPGLAMAPLPEAQVQIVQGQAQVTGTGNPGYPFFIPGVAGHRPPHPPLDTIDDGGLPRHIITGGTSEHAETRLDFHKKLLTADAHKIDEDGTLIERAAMAYHALRLHPSYKPDGSAGSFVTNGLPPQKGAPYSDPCIDDNGNAVGVPRTYKAAAFQFDIKLNKQGWHFPQQRILALWGDVEATLNNARPPEPFFFRANTNDCITFYHTNLVPHEYKQDDYQVRTPTDILGQHIHLVKFDVTSSDGSGNGWNYEDGTFSPDEVLERIDAINAFGGLKPQDNSGPPILLFAKSHPYFLSIKGAQTTIQRWYADNTLNRSGQDRTLRTVFTHDHYGPSTHQQVGLYAGLVIEPTGSAWRDAETGVPFGGRFDGGPTGWKAVISTANAADSYREFLLEFADFQHAYAGDVAINPPGRIDIGLPFLLRRPQAGECPGGFNPPCPEAISAAEPGTMVVNYRNEPIPLRVRNPITNTQTAGLAGDLSHVFRSDILRADSLMNVQPTFYPPLTADVKGGDPFTPLLRAYENDRVQIRILVGAHEEGHNFNVHGVKWLFEPSFTNSGYRNSQMMGISEHFEFIVPALPKNFQGGTADFLYQPGASVGDLWNGLWGLVRVYKGAKADLQTLPNNPNGNAPTISNVGDFTGVCPKTAPARSLDITAALARDILPNSTLVYNPRPTVVRNLLTGETHQGPLHDPTAILYVRSSDLDLAGKLRAGVPIEPLILRAKAGECLNVTLDNRLPDPALDVDGFNEMPMIVDFFNANQVRPSSHVGLHPQLVFLDVTRSDGANVGFNPVQTAAPGGRTTYQWYAGDFNISPTGFASGVPVEFGATNLISSDPIKHSNKGAIGALIIEPKDSTWVEDATARAQATVTPPGGPSFREFVLLFQNDVNLRYGEGALNPGFTTAVKNLGDEDDVEDSGGKAFNYKTEPIWFRMGTTPETPFNITGRTDYTYTLSNLWGGGDPVTPIFTAKAGTAVRFRILHPGGQQRNNVFVLHGHLWEEEPYANASTVIGSNPLSEQEGARMGHGPSNHFDAIPKNGAGGAFGVVGDYLYRTFTSFQFDGGMWGIFRVAPRNQPPIVIITASPTVGLEPLTVNFTATASDLDGQVVAYNWTFGDGSTGTGASTSHVYVSSGNYTATVTVTDNDGATASASVLITVNKAIPPAAPTNLVLSPGTSHVTVKWTDNSNNESGFKIERQDPGPKAPFVQIGTVAANVTTFTDLGRARNTRYCYRVRAFNAGGDSAYSNTACITTP